MSCISPSTHISDTPLHSDKAVEKPSTLVGLLWGEAFHAVEVIGIRSLQELQLGPA
jgi:hypothetical protein